MLKDLNSHAELIIQSYKRLIGEDLLTPQKRPSEDLYQAPFVVLSHGTQDDPIFNFANKCAQELFEYDWETFITLPSRLSAQAPNREERARLLHEVTTNNYIKDYSGIRISASGKRFFIKSATVWNLIDEQGINQGQAATFDNWEFLT